MEIISVNIQVRIQVGIQVSLVSLLGFTLAHLCGALSGRSLQIALVVFVVVVCREAGWHTQGYLTGGTPIACLLPFEALKLCLDGLHALQSHRGRARLAPSLAGIQSAKHLVVRRRAWSPTDFLPLPWRRGISGASVIRLLIQGKPELDRCHLLRAIEVVDNIGIHYKQIH